MASNSTNKRRRTAAGTLHISDLPVGFIADVSAYLSKPSRALLAVAFTSKSSSRKNNLIHQLSPISTAIISASQWDILDFEDIERELANKLTDDDISAVLKCINAHDVLKRLKLCGCINIEGHGLNPLRRSYTLEQIDLSMAKQHGKSNINPEPLICFEVVLPILDSIISLHPNQFSLKHIQIPHKWRDEDDDNLHLMAEFRARYNTLLSVKHSSCLQCDASMNNKQWLRRFYVGQYHTCYICLKHFCGDFDCVKNGQMAIKHYYSCDKDYCSDYLPTLDCSECFGLKCNCGRREECGKCTRLFCEDHFDTCDECNEDYCEECVTIYKCSAPGCNRKQCSECWKPGGKYSDVATQKEYNNVIECLECEKGWCFNCLPVSIKNEDCYGCLCISQGVEGR